VSESTSIAKISLLGSPQCPVQFGELGQLIMYR